MQQLTFKEEIAWKERVWGMFKEASEMYDAAVQENDKFREYLKTKYVAQNHKFE